MCSMSGNLLDAIQNHGRKDIPGLVSGTIAHQCGHQEWLCGTDATVSYHCADKARSGWRLEESTSLRGMSWARAL